MLGEQGVPSQRATHAMLVPPYTSATKYFSGTCPIFLSLADPPDWDMTQEMKTEKKLLKQNCLRRRHERWIQSVRSDWSINCWIRRITGSVDPEPQDILGRARNENPSWEEEMAATIVGFILGGKVLDGKVFGQQLRVLGNNCVIRFQRENRRRWWRHYCIGTKF